MRACLHHTGLVVSDRDRAVAFYRDALGLSVVAEYERRGAAIDAVVGYADTHLRSALLSSGADHLLELIQYVAPAPAERPTTERRVLGAGHVAVLVDDIEAAREAVVAHGGALLNPPAQLAPRRIVCYLQDLDGNWLELIQVEETAPAPSEAPR